MILRVYIVFSSANDLMARFSPSMTAYGTDSNAVFSSAFSVRITLSSGVTPSFFSNVAVAFFKLSVFRINLEEVSTTASPFTEIM